MSFYRKYRPQKLAEIVGQPHVRQTFLHALQNGTLSHAYLFAGSRGTGKTSTARIIARAVNCLAPEKDGEPCNSFEICRAALDGKLVDLIEIDAASNRGIDEIRDLKEKIQFSPSRAKSKIYVIDEVHMLTKEAFNALLKTLEEPPAHAFFILATTEPHKIPETIISRTQRFDFHKIETQQIQNHLATIAEKEGIKFETAALELIAKQSAGGMRDALGMLEQLGASGEITTESVAANLGLTRPKAVEDFVFALLSSDLAAALATIEGLVSEGANLIQFNKTILAKLRETMLQKVSQNDLPAAKMILVIIEEFTRAGEELKNAIISQLPLEAAAIGICSEGIVANSIEKKTETKKVSSKTEKEKELDLTEKKFKEVEKETSDCEISSSSEISVPVVEAALPQVLGKIQNPTVKMAMKAVKVLAATNSEIMLGVDSDFLIERLENSANLNLVVEKFSEVLGRDLKIKIERVEIEIQPTVPEPSLPPKPKKTIADAAEGLFAEGW